MNQQAISGETALHIAAHGGYRELVALLLEAGADPTLRDEQGFMALHSACNPEASGVMRDLIGDSYERITQNRDQTTNCGETCLILAASQDMGDEVEWLLTVGANPAMSAETGPLRDGETAWERAHRCSSWSAISAFALREMVQGSNHLDVPIYRIGKGVEIGMHRLGARRTWRTMVSS